MKVKNTQKIIIDMVMALGFVMMFNIRATGLTVHEIVGLIAGLIMIIHVLINWRWVVAITKKIFSKIPMKTRISYILNILLFLTAFCFIFAGVMISKVVMPTLGLDFNLQLGINWKSLHIFSGELAIILFGIHIGLHYDWIKMTVKKVFSKKTPMKYGKQIAGVLLVITLFVGGLGTISTVGKVVNNGVSLFGGQGEHDGPGGHGRPGERNFGIATAATNGMKQASAQTNNFPNRPDGGGGDRNGGFNFLSTLSLVIQYLFIFGAISIATHYIERIVKRPSKKMSMEG